MNKLDFAYITGLIRTLETKLLNQNELERMIDAKNFQDAYRVLNELDYSRFLDQASNPNDFHKVLEADLLETKKLLNRTCPYPWFLNIFWYRYDVHNIKTLLKAKLMGKEADSVKHLLIDIGNISFDTLIQYIFQEKKVVLDPDDHEIMERAIDAARKKYRKHENPQMVDYIIDKLYFELALEIAKRTNSPYIIRYIQHTIDLSNIKIFFRVERWESESPDKIGFLAEGGLIPFKTFFLSEDDFILAMANTEYKDLVEKSVKEMREKNQFIQLENEVENFITKYIRKRRFEAIGPEVVMNYFIAKKNNAMLVRLILIGKMNQIPADTIRKNARLLYSQIN